MSKKSFFNPVSNAKALAFLFFLLAFISLLDIINGESSLLGMAMGFLYLVIGIGLRKQKLWGVYGLGVLAVVTLLAIFAFGSIPTLLASFLIAALLFFWFYSAKSKFKK
ncbi:MAG: hypothetical protein PVJ09_03050 [Candidatus Woesebacteria bacterium]|jgi:hypothetical protein